MKKYAFGADIGGTSIKLAGRSKDAGIYGGAGLILENGGND